MTTTRLLALLMSLAASLFAAQPTPASAATAEITDVKDNPVVSRYAGSSMYQSSSEGFAAVNVPTGPGRYVSDKAVFDKAITVEGKVNGYFYVAPKERSALEVFRNYQQALGQAGFTTLYNCEMRACDQALVKGPLADSAVRPRKWLAGRSNPAGSIDRDVRFVSAKATRNGSDVYVLLYVAEPDSIWAAPASVLLVIEPAAMDSGKVVVASGQLKTALAAEGKIALYGLYFDTGSATLKAESTAQLAEMGRLLDGNKAMKVFIVGHTDSEGAFDANLALSQHRAETVVSVLTRDYKIDPARLRARGVANLSPVASNAAESGRARNRRVELVEQ